MSQYQTNGTVPSTRTQAEIQRLQAILSERNQQLQTAEQQNTQYEVNVKCARKNVRYMMTFCVLLIVAMALGGVQ